MKTSVVILAAGQGTRMNSDLPKVLHPVAGAALLHHAMRSAASLEPEHTVIVAGHGADQVKTCAEEHSPEAKTVLQLEQLGTAHAVLQARPELQDFDGDILVLYGDTPFIRPETLAKMTAARATADVVVLGFNAADPGRYGRLVTTGNTLKRIVEFKDASAKERAITLCNSGVMLAKAETADDVARMPKPVIPLIETARGLAAARTIAEVAGVVRLAFGTIDFMLDLGLPEDAEAMAIYRAELALASRLAGLAPAIDGVTPAIDDLDRVIAETRRALAFGFGARLCIHPAQIGPVHDTMRPGDDAINRARRIVAVAEAAGGGAIQLDGAMLDRPLVAQAEALLARAGEQ